MRWLIALVRVACALVFISFGLSKFTNHASELADFKRYGVPLASTAVYVIGVIEVLGGVMLLTGTVTRVAAAVLGVEMLGVVVTAGRTDGGPVNLGLAPLLLVAMVFLLVLGAGALAVDDHLFSGRARPDPAP